MKIQFTDIGKEVMKKTLQDRGMEKGPIRIFIQGFGWGGPVVGIALGEQNKDDILGESEEFEVYVEESIEGMVSMLEVDYSDKWYKKGFYISNLKGC